MGERGPQPIPTAIKKLRGTAPASSREPQPERIEAPRVPYGILGKDGRRLWRELAPKLSQNGLLTELDLPSLLMACAHYDTAVQAARTIRDQGILTIDERGLPRKHPALQVLRDNSTAFRSYADRFGLSPSSRTRLIITAIEDEPSLAEILRGEFGVVKGRGEMAKK